MKQRKNLNHTMLVIYLAGIFVMIFTLIYPIMLKPKDLTPTRVPSLSVPALMNANTLINEHGKVWTQYPSQPDPSGYSFGGKDPL